MDSTNSLRLVSFVAGSAVARAAGWDPPTAAASPPNKLISSLPGVTGVSGSFGTEEAAVPVAVAVAGVLTAT
jgi:hypothetical protein